MTFPKQRGGVIGCFTPVEVVVNIDENLGKVGNHEVGIKVPANKFVYGVYIKNDKDDLAGDATAKIGVNVGTTAELADLTVAGLKGKGKAKLIADALYVDAEADVYLTVATAALTAGKINVGVIYG